MILLTFIGLVTSLDPRTVVKQIETALFTKDSKLHHGAYNQLAYYSDTFGPRMWGSESEWKATDALITELEKWKDEGIIDDIIIDELKDIRSWKRGEESLTLLKPRTQPTSIKMIGLGLSGRGDQIAEVLVVKNFAELEAKKALVKGKIVLINFAWSGYGDTKDYRLLGAQKVQDYGGVGFLMKSIASKSIMTPHTGFVKYTNPESPANIPAAAISNEDAEMLQRMQDRGQTIQVHLHMENEWYTTKSRNVIAQIRGSQYPEQILVMGGHFDSWDTGSQTGANDDGGGVMVCLQALRVLGELHIRPKRTVRFIAWSGEEMSRPDKGAFYYADNHVNAQEDHILALENDHGSTKAIGYGITANAEAMLMIKRLVAVYLPEFYYILEGDGEMVDTAPLGAKGIPMIRNVVDDNKTRDFYFAYHHSAADTMYIMNPDDMDSNVFAISSLFYLVADADKTLPK